MCIAEGYILSDQRRPEAFNREQYFKTQAEMAELFADIPEALANSVEIAKRCNLQAHARQEPAAAFPDAERRRSRRIPDAARALEGLEQRLAGALSATPTSARASGRAMSRGSSSRSHTIVQMGFPGYFLIVADFINWAKTNGVPVGPGRGSGAGSLVAYSLGITDLDPLRYDLLFERFLNPERVSMPDFDIDFCQDGRDRVIDYVKSKYGADSVSQIATFGTMAAKAVVRDVGRVLDLGYNFCDQLAKLIPFQPGKHITLADAREMEPQLKEREKNEEEVAELLALAEKLEGLTRNVGMHAGGVLIAPGKLTDFCPLYVADASDAAVSQFDKDDVEAVGLVKFDFLGLTTLTILDWTLRYIKSSSIPTSTLTLENAAARRSRGVQDFLEREHERRVPVRIARHARHAEAREARPLRRHHRAGRAVPPGADGSHSVVLRAQARARARRLSRPARRSDPLRDLRHHGLPGAGDADGADHRRLQPRRRRPAAPRDGQEEARGDGAAARDLPRGRREERACPQRKADELFDLMEKFAGYGFNKSHAAAYALVAYQTAYMKAHHAAAFMAANMSAVMADTDKVQQLFDDAAQNGLDDAAARRQRERIPLRAARSKSRSATAWARSRAPAKARSRTSSRSARAAARSRISSISAIASTSASSTGAWSNRWCARARSIR